MSVCSRVGGVVVALMTSLLGRGSVGNPISPPSSVTPQPCRREAFRHFCSVAVWGTTRSLIDCTEPGLSASHTSTISHLLYPFTMLVQLAIAALAVGTTSAAPAQAVLGSAGSSGWSSSSGSNSNSNPRPLVIWHGLGDSAHSRGMDQFQDAVREMHPGIFVHSVIAPNDGSPSDESKAGWVSCSRWQWGVWESTAELQWHGIACIATRCHTCSQRLRAASSSRRPS